MPTKLKINSPVLNKLKNKPLSFNTSGSLTRVDPVLNISRTSRQTTSPVAPANVSVISPFSESNKVSVLGTEGELGIPSKQYGQTPTTPATPTQATAPVAPAITQPQKEIYRIGGDIFDASTNQKIPNVETLERDYAGASEIDAPVTPPGQSGPTVNAATGGVAPPVITPSMPVVPTAPVVPAPPTALETAEKRYESLLGISPEEEKTSAQLSDVLSSTRLGTEGLEGQGRAIPLNLIRGQQAKLEKQGLALAEPLSDKLARLEAKRLGTLEASKFRLGIESAKSEEAKTAAAEAAKPVTLAKGAKLVSPTGEFIAENAEDATKSFTDTYGTGSIGDYNFYKAQEDSAGRTPVSFNEYQNIEANRKRDVNTFNQILPGSTITPDELSPLAKAIYDGTIGLKDITATQRAGIAPELNAVGYTKAVTGEMKATVNFIEDGMDKLLTLWDDVPGVYKGLVQGVFGEKIGSKIDPKVAAFKAQVGIIGMTLTRMFEKGRISDQDRLFYLSLMPNLNMNKKTTVAGAKQLKQVLNDKITEVSSGLQSTPSAGGEFAEAW